MSLVDHVFLKLTAIYGNAWRNLFKSPEFLTFSKQEWVEALVAFDEPTIYAAVNVCRATHRFPPSIPEFIECCMHLKKKGSGYFMREQTQPCTPSVAFENLAKIRAILNMKPRGESHA